MPQTLDTNSEAASDADASDEQLAFEDSDWLKSFSMLFVGSVQGLFSCFSFSLRSLPVSHVEGSSLTTSLRYQDLRSCVLFFVIS